MIFLLQGSAPALERGLMQGQIHKGVVSILARDGESYAALDEILTKVGLAPSGVSGGLVVVFSGRKLEFWNGSNIARINGVMYSLPSGVFSQDGHWWAEADAALEVMNRYLHSISRPSNLTWGNTSNASAPSVSLNSVPVAPSMTASPTASPAAARGGNIATVSRIRWGEQADAYRAVIDISKQVDVALKEYPGRAELVFSTSSVAPFSSNSPWASLSASAAHTSGACVLTFRHNAKRIKSFWLQDPPRYVVDFYMDAASPVISTTPVVTAPPAGENKTPSNPGTINTMPISSGTNNGSGRKYLVVVDAGHGGHDPGAVGNSLLEKDINLKAAHELIASLKRLGIEVKATRTDDRYLKLAERTTFANNAKADIFISLHCNALPKGKHASGMELYLMAEPSDKDALNLAIIENRELSGEANNAAEVAAAADSKTKLLLKILGDMQQNDKITESTNLAEDLYNRTKAAGFSLRKVRQAPFFVLRGAGMPAVLVEMGYITEASDAKLLNSSAYRVKMMDSLAAGILDYLKRTSGGSR